jgi:DNA polymerase III delta prime subunit
MTDEKDEQPPNVPWIEKYRPAHFDDIVLDPHNRRFFQNILEYNLFPNLLFYGFPGSGKTSTIINLINEYQLRIEHRAAASGKSNVIHLNASNDRGIDIIRNQIQQFVCSHNIFNAGLKFVVLDEVDYMTKQAQQSLKNLIQASMPNVRYCLICNYVCKIDESLKQELICVRFNRLPKVEITNFIRSIAVAEGLAIDLSAIERLQAMYQCDIRSMVNYLQSNQSCLDVDSITDDDVWQQLFIMLHEPDKKACTIKDHILGLSERYNMDVKHVIKGYYNYVVLNKPELITIEYLKKMQLFLHDNDAFNQDVFVDYFTFLRI